MIRLFTATHRDCCLDAAGIESADVQAYDATIDRYYTELIAQATEDGLGLVLDPQRQTSTYLADTCAEQDWMMQICPFWEWYQAGNAA